MNRLLFTVLATAALLASCGTSSSQKNSTAPQAEYTLAQLDSIGKSWKPDIGKYGGELHVCLASDPNGFCPATVTSAYSNSVLGYIYEGLITVDPATMEYKGNVAKSWDISPDGIVWTFHLRNDVFFSDSVKLSAYDVEFTFNDVIYNDKINAPVRDNFTIAGKPIGVKAIDSFTVQFTLPATFAPFITVAGMEILPRHLFAAEAAKGTLESFLANGCPVNRVVGSGPFILDKVELGQKIVLRRNPIYWKRDAKGNHLPYLDRVVMLLVKEPNQEMLKFKEGEIDGFSLMGEHYPLLKPMEKEKNFSIYRVGPRWYDPFFAFNENNQINPKSGKPYLEPKKQAWFRNKNFRKACAYAVNYPEIINIVYNGLAYPPAGVWGPHKGPFSNPSATTYSYDPAKAKALLAQEGFKDINGDGFLEDAQGNTVEFSLTTTAGVDFIKKMYEIVRKDLSSVGLNVHLNLIEFNNLIDKTNNTFDWDVVAFSMGGINDPHFGKSSEIYSSSRYFINPSQKTPSYPWEARVAEIFEKGASEMDTAQRRALYREWQAITSDECIKVYMPLREVILGVNNRIGNVHLTKYLARGEDLLYNVDEIYIKQ